MENGEITDDKIKEACEALDLQHPDLQAQTLQILWFAADEAVRIFKTKNDQLQSVERDIKAYVTDFVGRSSKLDLQSSYIAASVTTITTSEREDFKTLDKFAEASEAQDGGERNTGSKLGSQLEKLEKRRKEFEDIKVRKLALCCFKSLLMSLHSILFWHGLTWFEPRTKKS